MQLTYRGINYQSQSLQQQNLATLGIAGRYRGVNYCISQPTLLSHQFLVAYRYRGVNYIKNHLGDRPLVSSL